MSLHTSGPFGCGEGPNWQGMGSGVCARAIFARTVAAMPPNRPDTKLRRKIFIVFLPCGNAFSRATPRSTMRSYHSGHILGVFSYVRGLLCLLAHPLSMRFAANWAPYHLRDFRTLFDELLHSFRLDLIARSREFDVNLTEHTAR